MERLWTVKFLSFNLPMREQMITCFFDSEETARDVFDRHAALLSKELHKEQDPLIFRDLMGHHCLRSDLFTYANMCEIGPVDIMWKEIDEKIKASQKAAGTNKDMGFKNEPEAK